MQEIERRLPTLDAMVKDSREILVRTILLRVRDVLNTWHRVHGLRDNLFSGAPVSIAEVYFEETKIRHIHDGDKAIVRLMGFNEDIDGHVESIARAIVDRETISNGELIANVNPTFSWLRLAQRIPVRIKLDKIPEDIRLSAGMTATVITEPQSRP
ncbi:HlyD family secretion protein [Microvirga sp. 2MCAF38]|uniref:HlyD family secretion protein n=1 Tax=Microvirga sp. 2MCAF38 TaxID=3232989 RepID=UPI003F99B780